MKYENVEESGISILLQNLAKRGRSEVIAVWERVSFMPLEQLRILQACR